MKSSKKIKIEYMILSVLIIIFLVVLGMYLNSGKTSEETEKFSKTDTSEQTKTAKASTRKHLPTGKQVYNYSHGSNVTGPKPSKLIIDPIDPALGETLTFTADIEHFTPITKVTAILITDNQEVEKILTLSDGDDKKGTWTTTWTIEDTYNFKYQIDLYVDSNDGNFIGGLTFR